MYGVWKWNKKSGSAASSNFLVLGKVQGLEDPFTPSCQGDVPFSIQESAAVSIEWQSENSLHQKARLFRTVGDML